MEHLTDVVIFGFTTVIIMHIVSIIILSRFNRLYNYFIKSKEEKQNIKFSLKGEGIPPINSECPTKEQLENLD